MKKETMLGKPGAPYAKAVKAGGFLFVSGNVAVNPETGQVPEGGIEPQTRQVLDNLKATVESSGLSFDDVVKVNIYLVDVQDFGGMNEVYKEYFPDSTDSHHGGHQRVGTQGFPDRNRPDGRPLERAGRPADESAWKGHRHMPNNQTKVLHFAAPGTGTGQPDPGRGSPG